MVTGTRPMRDAEGQIVIGMPRETNHLLASGDIAGTVGEWRDRYLGPPRR
jgi:hypothetical protein